MRKLMLTALVLFTAAISFAHMESESNMICCNPGMMSGKMMLMCAICSLVCSFAFSIIFWLTYNWLAKKKK